MSATTSALIVTLVGALVSTTTLVGPPSLPEERTESAPDQDSPSADDADASEGEGGDQRSDPRSGGSEAPAQRREGQMDPREGQMDPPAPVRSALPPGLAPVPFPLENQRHDPAPTSEDQSTPPAQERRSIVDLRDPFNRPPPRPRSDGERDPTVRLLMPDLKDPFAPGVRRVRSKTLDLRVPNDIRDPFNRPPEPGGPPACVKTTSDGTVVQAPGKEKVPTGECQRSRFDLRDPFDRDPNR